MGASKAFPVLLLLIAGIIATLPTTRPVQGQMVGTVCIIPDGASSCPFNPPAFLSGTVGSQLRVSVFIQGSDSINGFDIALLTDHTILKPAATSLNGTVLPGSLQIISECIGTESVPPITGGCSTTQDMIELAVVSLGGLAPAPVTGLLFTAVYNITSAGSASITYPTGCTSSSVSGTSLCVTTANGTTSPVPETVETALFATPSLPDFTMNAIPNTLTIFQGSTGKTQIVVNGINGFQGNVTLTPPASCLAIGCPSYSVSPTVVSLSPSHNSSTAEFTIQTDPQTPLGTVSVGVTGTSGNLAHIATVSYTVVSSSSGDFIIAASPSNQTVQAGSTATSLISLFSINNFSGTVNLTTSAPPLCPSCPGWTISPSNVFLPIGGIASSTLTFYTTTGSPSGIWTVTVTGASGSLSHSVFASFTIVSQGPAPDFAISANPTSLTLQAGSTATSTITLTSLNSFNGTVYLSTSPSPLCPSPICTVWSISPSQVDLGPGGTAKATLTILAGQSGSGNITVSGTSGKIQHFVSVTSTIIPSSPGPSFTISSSPSSVVIVVGSSAVSTINVTSLNGFSGTVFLASTSLPAGLSTSLNPTSISLAGGGTGPSMLTISSSSSTPTGSYLVVVTGTNGTYAVTTSVAVAVISSLPPPDFTLTVSPTTATISKGSSTTYTVAIQGLNGFNGTVTLSATVSPVTKHGPTTSLPSTVGPYSTSTMLVSTARSTQTGTYTITVTATSGGITHTYTVTLVVTR